MTWGSTLALLGSLVVLAALPSLSVLTVVVRSASLGWLHGVCVALGIVLGDGLLILLALGGLTLLGGLLGDLAPWFQRLAGLYLILLGVGLYRRRQPLGLPIQRPPLSSPAHSQTGAEVPETPPEPRPSERRASSLAIASLGSSVWLGLGLTLADQKAAIFYLGFLPAFLDLDNVTKLDLFIVLATAMVAVGGVKVGYAVLGDRARSLLRPQYQMRLTSLASFIMIGVGVALIVAPIAAPGSGAT